MMPFLAAKPARGAALAALIGTALLLAGIALSRVYVGVHYPSDVFGGLLFGGAWTLLVRASLRGPGRQPHRLQSTSKPVRGQPAAAVPAQGAAPAQA